LAKLASPATKAPTATPHSFHAAFRTGGRHCFLTGQRFGDFLFDGRQPVVEVFPAEDLCQLLANQGQVVLAVTWNRQEAIDQPIVSGMRMQQAEVDQLLGSPHGRP